jgi:hypothetical protein
MPSEHVIKLKYQKNTSFTVVAVVVLATAGGMASPRW